MGCEDIPSSNEKNLPHYAEGPIVKGFGRGSSELGFPTANFDEDIIVRLPNQLVGGVYWGFAQVESSPVYGMVMSIGWNPFYKNKKRAMETHILHEFDSDLYGKHLRVVIVDFLRPECNFPDVEALKNAIAEDIKKSKIEMRREEFKNFAFDSFFKSSIKAVD
eukprot:TRINITY_DN34030_c0_g1_i10.p1 TRINITY_DN34030_c0_g1~~TRINITY_DN34030_c0_g1_i10.p1  ORF type:complete len:163 (-),score=21.65 TRINITY_DN34030_c0_g1_i10:361-849(-)